ncbi:MAG: UvrD-helicase domain-containing protein, partial [Trichococcus sp.]
MHKDLMKEQERVHRVIQVITNERTRLAEQVEEKSEKQRQQLKESKEIKISQGSSESVWESSAELRAFEQELMIRNNELQNSNERVAVLDKMQDEPYFGRIDYHDDFGNETIYIGIGSLFEKDENLIVDWRSPIASLYYEGSKGEKVKLMIADQPMSYGVDLKRQFLIRHAEIVRMMDTDNVMGDPYLLEVLEGPSSYQMGTVVSTLQKEQNQIVRETKAAVTLIEGVAGSGKTVVLMQKIAYLLYAFRDQLKSEEVVLFSPNKIFQEYVSQVLPALGELNVGNTTFSEFMERKVTGFSLRADQEDSLAKVTVLKGSLAFYEALQKYGMILKKRYLKFSDIRFHDDVILSQKEIESAFYSIDSQGSLASKLDILKRHLLLRVERIQQSQKGKPWVEKEMIAMSDLDLYRYEKETHNQKAMEEAMTAD